MRHNYVGTEHLLIAILNEATATASGSCSALGAQPRSIAEEIGNVLSSGEPEGAEPVSGGVSGNPKGKGNTKTLEQFGRDLTAMASRGEIDPVIGRQSEIERVIQIFSRRTKNNPCLDRRTRRR